MNNYRIGFGYDIHRLAKGYDLWLGGLHIPHHLGSVGHSDADVLIHSICDALLGALALGDIGKLFPDTDEQWKGQASRFFLQEVMMLVRKHNYQIANIDSTIVLETPKLRPYIDEMRLTLATIMNIEHDQVSIKATTSEKMSFVGEELGVKAYATVLLYQ